MRLLESSKNRKGAFPPGRLLSFFVFSGLLFLASCRTLVPEGEPEAVPGKRAEKQLERIQKERRIVFAVTREIRGEAERIRLAEKAAALLGVEMILFRAAQEDLPSLLRSGRADFAWGAFRSEQEILSCYLMPLAIPGKEETLLFALPPGSKNWKIMLQEALTTALAKGEK